MLARTPKTDPEVSKVAASEDNNEVDGTCRNHNRLHLELLEALSRVEESEKLIRRKNEQLEARNRDLREYSAAVTHELRAPLAAVKGFTEMFSDLCGDKLDAKGKHLLERIYFNVLQMDQIIRGLQELVLSGQESESRTSVDPKRVVRNVLDNRSSQLETVGAAVEIDSELPHLDIHPTKLYQLLDNLLSNALKQLAQVPSPQIVVTGRNRGDETVFSVEDNGPSVPAEHRSRVFELFFRLSREKPGVGLGLGICTRIVELYSGRIWIEDSKLGGAAFCFTLPDCVKAKSA